MLKTIKKIVIIAFFAVSSIQGMMLYKDAHNLVSGGVAANKKVGALKELEELDTGSSSRLGQSRVLEVPQSRVLSIVKKYGGSSTQLTTSISQSSTQTTPSAPSSSKEQKVACEFGQCHEIPKELQGKGIEYLSVAQQKAASCGYHSVANAWAIENLLRNKKKITGAAIDQEKGDMSGTSAITDDIILNQANELAVENLYVMGYDPEMHFIGFSRGTLYRFYEVFEKLKNKSLQYAFFVCHTGGFHWFLVAIIRVDGNLKILCIDSLNTPMKVNDARYQWLEYFYNLIRPSETELARQKAEEKKKNEELARRRAEEEQSLALARQLQAAEERERKKQEEADAALARALQESQKSGQTPQRPKK